MTADELRDLLIARLAKANGGGSARWRRAVAGVKTYPRATHAHCNWEARATGTAREIDLVERAADALRVAIPFVEDR
jgi:hypothetical protein